MAGIELSAFHQAAIALVIHYILSQMLESILTLCINLLSASQSVMLRDYLSRIPQILTQAKGVKLDQKFVVDVKTYFENMNNFISSIIQSVCSMVSSLVLLRRLGLLSLGLQFFTTLVINELFLYLFSSTKYAFSLSTMRKDAESARSTVRDSISKISENHDIYTGQPIKLQWFIESIKKENHKLKRQNIFVSSYDSVFSIVTKSTNRLVHPIAAIMVLKKLQLRFPIDQAQLARSAIIGVGSLLQIFQIFVKFWGDAPIKKNFERSSLISSSASSTRELSSYLSSPFLFHTFKHISLSCMVTLKSLILFFAIELSMFYLHLVLPSFFLNINPLVFLSLYYFKWYSISALLYVTYHFLSKITQQKQNTSIYFSSISPILTWMRGLDSVVICANIFGIMTMLLSHLSGNSHFFVAYSVVGLMSFLLCQNQIHQANLRIIAIPKHACSEKTDSLETGLEECYKKSKPIFPSVNTIPKAYSLTTFSTSDVLSAQNAFQHLCNRFPQLHSRASGSVSYISLNSSGNPLGSLDFIKQPLKLYHNGQIFQLSQFEILFYSYVIASPQALTYEDTLLLREWPFFLSKITHFLSCPSIVFDPSNSNHLVTLQKNIIPKLSGGQKAKLHLAILYALCHIPLKLKDRTIVLLLHSCIKGFSNEHKQAILNKFFSVVEADNSNCFFFHAQSFSPEPASLVSMSTTTETISDKDTMRNYQSQK
ncbi:MAG: hypothetical protein VX112_01275 [Pseudomonadota bacterium]|nr:hypothetical protein [Pseudomonadota bacterium]